MRQIVIILFLALVLTSFCSSLRAQQIIAKRMPFWERLSSNEVIDIHQDQDGFIWLGTSNGLERYDGYGLQRFRSNYYIANQLSDNYIICFSEDSRFLWIGTQKGVNLLDKKTYLIIPFPNVEIQKKAIKDILHDSKGQIWIATENNLYQCNSDLSLHNTYSLQSAGVNSIYEDTRGNIWALTWGSGLFKYQRESDRFIQYPRIGDRNAPFEMYQDKRGHYWIATWGDGIWSFDPFNVKNKMYHKHDILNFKTFLPETICFNMIQDDTFGYLWVLSYFELNVFKISEKGELEKIDISQVIDKGKMFSKLRKDRDGNLWLGSYDEGYTILFDKTPIKNFQLPDVKKKIGSDANVTALCEDGGGVIWFNQERYGLCLFDTRYQQVTFGFGNKREYPIDVDAMCESRDNCEMWVGTKYGATVYRMRRERMKVIVKEKIDLANVVRNPGRIINLLEDTQGNLWIATFNHLFFKKNNDAKVILVQGNIPVFTSITQDRKGYIWGVNSQKGIYQLKYTNKIFIVNHYYDSSCFTDSDKIVNLCIDGDDNVWTNTTRGRIISLDRNKRLFKDRTEECNVKGKDIVRIMADQGSIWIMTNKSLIRHDLSNHGNTQYSTSDENIFISSFKKAAYSSKRGIIYAGGHGGFIAVQHTNEPFQSVKSHYPVKITDIRSKDQSLLFTYPATGSENSVQKVVLSPADRNIEICFSSLTYLSSNKAGYAYKMEGVDKDWVYIGEGKHSAFYNFLSKGDYIFKVKTNAGSGNWENEATLLSITMLPAYYETWYAYLIYLFVSLFVIYCLFRMYIRRLKLKNSLRFQEELTQTKLNYFTNISHELLTPLTIISCVVDNLEISRGRTEKQMHTLRANVDRLKRLIQQILDFRKMECRKMKLNVSEGNITDFISIVSHANFQPLIEQKNIRFSIQLEGRPIRGYLDFDKMDKILYNLLSNAVKYTPEYKSICLTVNTEDRDGHIYLIVSVTDEGVGISSKDITRIFTRFYTNRNCRGSESNGIGLSMTKELVELHHGTIRVDSELHKGSSFTVEIPIDSESYTENERADLSEEDELSDQESEAGKGKSAKNSLMIIDDNEELLELMKNLFVRNYQVITAKNGEEGLAILKEYTVDVIICDVMMPKMNGLEFCRVLKEDLAISHIPILMLTAKNTVEDQIECYNAGANGYIAKPFELKVLYARIENLIKSNRKLQQEFRKNTELNISALEYQTPDEQFLDKAVQCIEKHLIEPDFDMLAFSSELNVSKATLNRKIKAMTGLAPVEFVRNVRLKHACFLLEKLSVNISDVAYAVGFSNPRYFTRCFKEEFGMTPSEYQNHKHM